MKYKMLAVLINAIFLISIAAVANPITDDFKENKRANIDDPVPIWNVDDYWTFNFYDFTVNYTYGDIKIFIDGRIDDLNWTVVDTSGTDYKVKITGEINADYYEVYMPFSSKILHITGSIKPSLTSLSGTIVFTQSDLEVKDISAQLKGIIFAKISPIPFSIPIPFKLTLDSDLSVVFPIFDFPLSDNKFWSLPDVDIVSNLKVGGIFGLIKFPFTITSKYYFIPFAFHCKPKIDVTVEAGTYNAYNIS